MNKFKATLATLLLPFVFFAILIAFLTAAPPPVHAFAGDYALKFDGQTDWVQLPRAINVIGSDWRFYKSVSLWVKPDGPAPSVATIAQGDLIFGDQPRWFGIYWVNRNSDPGDKIWIWNSADSSENSRIGIPHTYGEWVYITLVHDNTTLYAYKNGVLVGSVATGPTAQVIEDNPPQQGQTDGFTLRIGGTVASYEVVFAGEIDEVSIWSSVRSENEIRQTMYQTLSGSETGLAAYYQMSNGSGTTLADDSGNGHTGTLRDGGSAAPADGDTAAWVASGAFAGPRNALAFDGVDDFLAVNAPAATVLGGGWASDKTAELWAYPTGTAPVATSAAGGSILLGNANWGIARAIIGGEDRLWLFNNDNDGEDRLGLPYAADAWTHLALVHSDGLLHAYQNGALLGSIASGDTAVDSNLVIGQGFTGRLDEARLWSTARTAVQIQENMARTLAHNEGGLAAYYRFDQENDGTVTTVYDTAVNSHHAAMTNMNPATAWVASTAFNTWIGSESSNWADGANWSRYAAPTATDNAGLYNYPASNAPEISAGSFANSVLIASGATLTVQSGGSLRADGLWFNQGTLTVNNGGALQQEQAVDGSAPVRFFADGNYGPFTIDGNGFDLGATTITARALANCTTGGPEQTVQRCIDIAPTNLPTTGDPGSILTFSFLGSELPTNACNTLNAFHWDGSGWDELTRDSSFGVFGRQCTTEPFELRVTGVTDFSPFMLTNENNPTAVSLQTFSVASTPGVALLLLIGSVFMLLTAVVVYGRRAD